MDFQWINPNSSGKIDVSIAEYGITFYMGAIEELGTPEAVMLGFDVKEKILGVKPCRPDEENAILFKEKLNEKGGYIRISNKNIIRYIESKMHDGFKIESKAQKYYTKWDDEQKVLLIYMNQPIE